MNELIKNQMERRWKIEENLIQANLEIYETRNEKFSTKKGNEMRRKKCEEIS